VISNGLRHGHSDVTADTNQTSATPASTSSSIAMMGDGFYSSVSLGPKAVIDSATPMVLDVLEKLDLSNDRPRPLTLADFGSADGGTSLDLINASVDWTRRRYPDLPVSLVYTDLPGADFGTLFRIMNNELADKDSPLERHSNVHAFSSGLSFYNQLLPTGTLDVGFSASAMHYLSRMPCVISNHVHAVGASAPENAAFREVANKDWETILLQRSRELSPGGRVVLVNFCIDENGQYLGNTGGVNLFDTYNELWAGMRDDGLISAAEYTNTAFQQHYKSIDDTLAPLLQEAGPVYQSGLVLEHFETAIVECPFRRAFQQGLDVQAFARQFVNTHRSWTETTFRAGLDPKRAVDEANALLDELYSRYEQRVIASPDGHGKDLLHLYLIAVKRSPRYSAIG